MGTRKRTGLLLAAAALAALLALGPRTAVPAAAADPCAAANEIVCENARPGTPQSVWDIDGAGDPTIQGFTTAMSVDAGETVRFKVKTDAAAYTLEIYRLGWYGGDGARLVTTVLPSAPLPQEQPECLSEPATGLVDCGNWGESASWAVPGDAVSGVYLARLVRADTGGDSHVVFVVRDDDGASDLIFQTADTTWQAYNRYGGNSLYVGSPAGRAYKVSYNRPFTTREYANPSWLFSGEYPLLRFIERNGYDVSYTTGVDSDLRGAELLEHRAFLSVGHDEYWSGQQRANVEAARAAGVHLAFFSGNEVFWKTRWEPGIDAEAATHRTLVSYKETAANAKIDPSPEWTGTWRDPRFSPPADGGRPENALTGTLFTVNSYREDALRVPADLGKLRLWRHTSVAALPSGTTATFPAGVLGHEWDEDVDNGHRPGGLFKLSSTTVSVDRKIQDHGSTYGPGTATHALTLYRHASGALVFGAGTVQWGWGLDAAHDTFSANPPRPPDSRLQQATVNLFADMGVRPGSLQAGLVAAAKSTDTTRPTSRITSPASGSSTGRGATVTISGTASDSGGAVGGVEVSVDGGATWHPASGRTSWSYKWVADGLGPMSIRSRAVDDSGNVEVPGACIVVDVTCPCSFWTSATLPATPATTDAQPVEVGVKFSTDVDGWITGVRFYKGSGNGGSHFGSLWRADGTLLARAFFTGETSTGWQTVAFDAPVPVTAGSAYVASYHAPLGRYALNLSFFAGAGFVNAPLRAPADGTVGGNGVYAYSPAPAFPSNAHLASNYWVDVVFHATQPADTTPPTVTALSPTSGSKTADTRALVTATFSEAVDPATVNSDTFELRDAAGALVAATVSWDGVLRRAVLDPVAPLPYSSGFTATVKGAPAGVHDRSGNPLASNRVWSFTTAGPPTCPCRLFPNSTRPAVEAGSDTQPVELGVKLRADLDGWISAVRFYKGAGNAGPHPVSLWTGDGRLLARTTAASETATGWQEVVFDGPVAVARDTTFVASYHAPVGRWPVTTGAFASGFDKAPLRALPDGAEGGNGVFRYGGPGGFPTESYAASNYLVDVVFHTTRPNDTRRPRIVSVVPAEGAVSAPVGGNVEVVFSEDMNPATISTSTVLLTAPGGVAVAAAVSYDAATRRAVLDPDAPLAYGTAYTARVRGGSTGVRDVSGNALQADKTWSFTTPMCPCSLFSVTAVPSTPSRPDDAAELGVAFRSEAAGSIRGIRFYKGAGNTGVHVGSLWTRDGILLARATFSGESASGWQQVLFDVPVPIAAGEVYVASYHAPNGGYAVDASFFAAAPFVNPPLEAVRDGAGSANGLYRYSSTPAFPTETHRSSNYWVDVVLALS